MSVQRIPWWQRELNARLARSAQRRARRRRVALRVVGAAGLTAAGLSLVLVLGHDTRARVAPGTRATRSNGPTAGVGSAPTSLPTNAPQAGDALLTLAAPPSGSARSAQSPLRVTLTTRAGAPLPGITIWLTTTGLVPYSGAATTDTSGVATFTYPAGSTPYVVHITATADGTTVAKNTVKVGPAPAITTTEITGRFYASDGRCTYNTPPTATPLFVAQFPTINFAGRPFTDYGTATDHAPIVATFGANQIGIGQLNHFNAAFTGTLLVHTAGDALVTFLIDDAFNFGVGGGASRVTGTMSNPPATGRTALQRLLVVGAFNQGHLEALTTVTMHFPHPGSYPFEIDYAECQEGGEALRVSTDGQFLSVAQTGK